MIENRVRLWKTCNDDKEPSELIFEKTWNDERQCWRSMSYSESEESVPRVGAKNSEGGGVGREYRSLHVGERRCSISGCGGLGVTTSPSLGIYWRTCTRANNASKELHNIVQHTWVKVHLIWQSISLCFMSTITINAGCMARRYGHLLVWTNTPSQAERVWWYIKLEYRHALRGAALRLLSKYLQDVC